LNTEYFRFWHFLPRLVLSLAVTAELLILALGPAEALAVPVSALGFVSQTLGGFAAGVATVLLVLLAIVCGSIALDAAVALVGWLQGTAGRQLVAGLSRPSRRARRGGSRHPVDIAFEMFMQHEQQILEYLELYGASQPAAVGHREEVTRLCKDIGRHMQKITNREMAALFAYFAGVTQEQKFEEHLRSSVDDIYHVWVVAGLAVWVVAANLRTAPAVLGAMGALVAALVPLLAQRRRRLAHYLLYNYLQTFLFGEQADTADREAF
jgi:hypothetical protein